LCALAESHSDHVVFKGGTSLSKGWGLTQRFSEDIDLVVDVGTRGESARDSLLKAIAQDVADICALPMARRDSEKGRHRSVAYEFEAVWAGGELIKPSVLLEMGTRSALNPVSERTLTTLLAAAVPEIAHELPECRLLVLAAERTFVEKLFVIHGSVARYQRDPDVSPLVRIGRHYYDVGKLLADPTVQTSVGTAEFWEMARDHDHRGAREFSKRHVAPADLNFASSPGLFPDPATRTLLEREYSRDRSLFFDDAPSLDDVLSALQSVRSRLTPYEAT